jgi:excinuclease ABC subunit C
VADPLTYRPAPGQVPDAPGVYRFHDAHGRVIYVGKAKSLRSRLGSYFQDAAALHPRTQAMVSTATSVDWVVVSTEVEALQLEYSWIKEFDPRFNVRYRDDKSYPYLAITMDEQVPRVLVMRGQRRDGARYFGPYSHAWAIRETVDLLLRVFPMRSCTSGVYKRAQQMGRPCLLGYIDKCAAPCVGRVSVEEHRQIADEFCAFMAGRGEQFIRRLDLRMREAAAEQDYEKAARLRDDIGALTRAMERNAVVLGDGTDADVIALVEDPLEAAVQVFHVRGGRIRGQRGFVVDRVEDADQATLMVTLLQQLYGSSEGDAVPKEVLVNVLPADVEIVTQWLSQRRGSKVELRVPARGDKRSLVETVQRNASQAFTVHKTKRASDLTARSQGMAEIMAALDLPEAPLRIECIDVSHLQGSDTVASLVVFEDGLPRKSDYRRFVIRTVEGSNDVASIGEVVTRRFRRHVITSAGSGASDGVDAADSVAAGEDGDASADVSGDEVIDVVATSPGESNASAPRRFAYPPNLLVVDGGAPQVAAAVEALDRLGVVDIAVCGLAKRLEEVWLPDRPDPVILPRQSEGLYLLQRVRDEAHRFAISHHRQRRSATMVTSALDGIPGLGEVRRKALMRSFGSLRRLSEATVEQIAAVPGIGPATAQAIRSALDGTDTAGESTGTSAGTPAETSTGSMPQTDPEPDTPVAPVLDHPPEADSSS